MKFWKYGRVALALMGSAVFVPGITSCGVYTSGYMYVLGSQPSSGQAAGSGTGQAGVIGAFKIDHDYGYLTPIKGSPFSSGGTDPVQAVLIANGRFLAVLNAGQNGSGAGVTMFTIGGSGVLYSQQQSYPSSGSNPVSIGLDPGGNYLYVVDQLAPDNSGRGDITVFAIDQQTGRLTLVTNPNDLSSNGAPLTYFEVNYKPVQVISSGSGATGFVYVLDQAYNPGTSGVPAACLGGGAPQGCVTPDVFVYGAGTGGVLNLTQNAPLQIGTLPGAASTIATGGGRVFITDTANGQNSGRILVYTIGPGGVLQTAVGTPVDNQADAAFYPDAILTSSNGQFLYVANFGVSPITVPNSNISAFTLVTGGPPQLVTGSPFMSGSGPIWMALDPTNQYLYTANFNDNTITAKVIGATHGSLSNLSKGGTVFKTVSQPTFVVVSGRTY